MNFPDSNFLKSSARHQVLGETFNIEDAIEAVSMDCKSPYMEFRHSSFSAAALRVEIEEAFSDLGWYGMKNLYSEEDSDADAYGGLGLTFNPRFQDSDMPPLRQVLGSRRNSGAAQFFESDLGKRLYQRLMERRLDKWFIYRVLGGSKSDVLSWLEANSVLLSEEKDELERALDQIVLKKSSEPALLNSYHDSYGFTSYTKAAELPCIARMLSNIKRQVIRSRIAEYFPERAIGIPRELFWHRDARVFEELRLVFCIKANPGEYSIALSREKEIPLQEGRIYSWDTALPHAVSSSDSATGSRINLVLGICPWFDYDAVEQSWKPNEFFGKKHPMQMLVDGDVMDGLEWIET